MKAQLLCFSALLMGISLPSTGQTSSPRSSQTLEKGWMFSREDNPQFATPEYNDKKWQAVRIPHDWSIYGPFSADNDKQLLAISQDGQKTPIYHLGRTAGLPFVGVGWYRTHYFVPQAMQGKVFRIIFDGAMSHAQVYINGKLVGNWPYGYNSFSFDITPYLQTGADNVIAVRLENKPEGSRWYPGAGLYRNVHIIASSPTHIAHWGNQIQTPIATSQYARIDIKSAIEGAQALPSGSKLDIESSIISPSGTKLITQTGQVSAQQLQYDSIYRSSFSLEHPQLWDLGSPQLYRYAITLRQDGKILDSDTTTFGIRTVELRQNQGFFLNGRKIKFQGVCLHHDLGPLGGAVNTTALRRQIRQMQDMGVNAIRTSHNMPAPELVQLCDEMGMMLMAESFDCWARAKVPNGYNLEFEQWHERDLTNLVRQYRNNPSVVMWCIGNEVEEQPYYDGTKWAKILQNICHREDPTRPVTNGMNDPVGAIRTGMMAEMDVPGVNYHNKEYDSIFPKLPQGVLLGSETASTLSSRGVYKFPVERKSMAQYPDHQASGYDVEHCGWSSLPEDDWLWHEDRPWAMGEFVWTGIDYLGEPTPYYTAWPSHSSLFGAIDLAGIPKDRFYLYRSHWNKTSPTLHILPHWTWPGREGEITPIFVYTSYPEAEVFINGKSQGRLRKDTSITLESSASPEDYKNLRRQRRYRLMWMDTRYEPGTLSVVAYDESGKAVAKQEIHTAGKPDHLVLEAEEQRELIADGKDLGYVRVKLVDKDGNLIPQDEREIKFTVRGAGVWRAAASGNAASLDLFHLPKHHLFAGQLTAIVQTTEQAGDIVLTASASGVKPATIRLRSH